MSNSIEVKQAMKWFITNGIHAWIDDGDVYIEVENDNFEVFAVQISTSELSYRSDRFKDENQGEIKMKGEYKGEV